ncbi:hypothetical protein PIROE2DRAFT_56779 [Piromyces sp. E2]|nr:hypothetical protein PIROE2DRAFT_56779 [Piromyces sp. E2]|eukprot:OUM70476.1 hypothetical protein PIROE2DRAFT_56779 [Piromyces sp. E2]
MQSVIAYSELRSFIYCSKIDTYQTIVESFIKNDYFPWVCLVLLYSRKKWKRPITLILIAHWFLRSIGDLLNNLLPIRPWVPDTYWPYTNENWFICCALANVFWLSGEIIGDWYALLRTRAVTNKSKKTRIIYVTLIIYNLVKVANICVNFMVLPFDLRLKDEEGNLVKDIALYKMKWWTIVSVMQVASLLYDLSIIFSLKTLLFNKLKEYRTFSDNTFLNKFKQISEFRIILSMIASIAFLPFVGLFLYYVIHEYKSDSATSYIPSDETVDYLRRVVLNFNYTLMYIDQILLKNISNQNSKPKPTTNNFTSSYGSSYAININQNSNSNLNLSMSQQSIVASNNTNISVAPKEYNSNESLDTRMYNSNDNMIKNPSQNKVYGYNNGKVNTNMNYNGNNMNNYNYNSKSNKPDIAFIDVGNPITYEKKISSHKSSNVYYIKLKNSEENTIVNNYESSLSSPSSAETLYNDVYSRKSFAGSSEINLTKSSINSTELYNNDNNIIVKQNGNINDKLLFKKNTKYDSIYDLYSQQNQQRQY